ncbi:MAG: hypothetical protein NHB32_16310 [Fischerella sp. CENA71]|nr:hypothetical protein [Fischerella sp. CENA71]
MMMNSEMLQQTQRRYRNWRYGVGFKIGCSFTNLSPAACSVSGCLLKQKRMNECPFSGWLKKLEPGTTATPISLIK